MIISMERYRNERKCSVEGCNARYFGQGYCGRHYQRVRNHGHLEPTRPTDWGSRKKHPRYQQWQNILRREAGCASEWDDFDRYLADVGDRPSADHALHPVRPHDPMGPDNFRWVLRGAGMTRPKRRGDSCKVAGCKKPAHALDLCHAHHARWLRKGTLDDPTPRVVDHAKRKARRKSDHLWKYNLTPAQFTAMNEAQGGLCAICRGPPDEGKPLSVDHCHETEKVRGLLCARCNTGIGMLGDSVDRLFVAIQYLSAHKAIGKVS